MSDKIFAGICNSQDFVPSDFFWSFIGIKSMGEVQTFRSRHPWDVVRNNIIIDKFLKSDCNILVKMDIDQRYPSNFFEKMIPLVNEYKVAGPLIYDRWPQNGFIPLAFKKYLPHLVPMDLQGLTGVIEIPYPHTNLFYHREVLEKIERPWYEAHLSHNGLDRDNHVDFSFINKIHKVGYKVMIDLNCVVGHQVCTFIDRAINDDK